MQTEAELHESVVWAMRLTKLRPCTALVRLDEKISHYDNSGARLIVIPDAYKRQPLIGTVVAVGPPKVDDEGQTFPIGLEVGERVYLGPYNGQLVDLDDGHEYRLCQGYNPDPHLKQAKGEIEHPETAWPDIYAVIETDDGEPYEGTPSKAEVRAWISSVMAR